LLTVNSVNQNCRRGVINNEKQLTLKSEKITLFFLLKNDIRAFNNKKSSAAGSGAAFFPYRGRLLGTILRNALHELIEDGFCLFDPVSRRAVPLDLGISLDKIVNLSACKYYSCMIFVSHESADFRI